MFVSCWSAKGGSGTTVVAAGLALVLARKSTAGCLLVDLAGDAPAALGLPEPVSPGLAGWLAAGAGVPADGLTRLEVPVTDGLTVVPRGEGPLGPPARAEALAGLLATESRSVVIDCGTPCWQAGAGDAATVLAAAAADHFLVTRPCYLSLRRAQGLPVAPTGIVLVSEAGRALSRQDVEHVVGAEVVAEVAVDPAIARAVDAGLLTGRLPRGLERSLGLAT